jgi:hypothetical protein
MILRANGTIISVDANTNGELGYNTIISTLVFGNIIMNQRQNATRLFDAVLGVREGSVDKTSLGEKQIEYIVVGDIVFDDVKIYLLFRSSDTF